jgi:hypothetical protein
LTENKTKNSDCEIVYTLEASEDEKIKARQYKLPENFYNYEKKPECIGCRGCEKNHD